jgi:predicted ArsR family transcriptional regulator
MTVCERTGPGDVEPHRTDRHLLELLGAGASAAEAAAELGVPLTEVARRLTALRAGLGVTSTREVLQHYRSQP